MSDRNRGEAPFLVGVEVDPSRLRDHPDGYPFSLPWVAELALRFASPLTILVGENGSGKSTLLKALAHVAELPGGGGTKNDLADNDLDEPANALASILRPRFRARPKRGFYYRADNARGFADLLDRRRADPDFRGDPYAAYGGTSLHSKSSGQAALARFRSAIPPAFVLLDEPENGLSVVSQLALGRLIAEWIRDGSQVVLATHSVVLLGVPGACLVNFDEPSLPTIDRRGTTHWTIASRVLSDPAYFRRLIEDE